MDDVSQRRGGGGTKALHRFGVGGLLDLLFHLVGDGVGRWVDGYMLVVGKRDMGHVFDAIQCHGGDEVLEIRFGESVSLLHAKRGAWISRHNHVEARFQKARGRDRFQSPGLGEDAEIDRRGVLTFRVDRARARGGEDELGEFARVSEAEAQLLLQHLCFLRDVEARQEVVHLGLITSLGRDADFRGRRRLVEADIVDVHQVPADLVHLDLVDDGHHIGVVVALALEFVQQLRPTRVQRHLATPVGSIVHADFKSAVVSDGRNRQPKQGRVDPTSHRPESSVVAAGDVERTFDQVAGDERVRQFRV